jgi:hypothetical protein
MTEWADEAQRELIRLVRPGAGWPYRDAGAPAAEPTALASLALLAVDNDRAPALARDSARWLARMQRPDGAVGVNESLPAPTWPTSYAVLLWSATDGGAEPAERAVGWLLQARGETFRKPESSPLGHDTSIPGWSWVDGTHSWLEPTALAVLALRRAGRGGHERVRLGLDLIRDRAIPEGGWNFGNNVVFGASLRPKPGPTALALLALAGVETATPLVERSLDYLAEQTERVRSPQSLGLGVLALAAWERAPDAVVGRLEEAYRRLDDRGDRSCSLAYLLLASTGRSLDLLGLGHG